MFKNTMRMIMCAGVAAVLGAAGNPARAAHVSPIFDPEFDGVVVFNIDDACLLNADGTYDSTGVCTLDLLSASVFDTTDTETIYSSGFQGNVGSQIVILNHEVFAIETVEDDFPLSCGELCGGDLSFFTSCDGTCGPGGAELTGTTIQGTLSDGYRLVTTVPEPGTLGLLFGGIGAAWLARRRKKTIA